MSSSNITVVMGTPEAAQLQLTIQHRLAQLEYADDDDPVMAEYITVMLANSKTKEMITDELLDLIGDGFDSTFTDWLFRVASGQEDAPPSSVEEVKPEPSLDTLPSPPPPSASAPASASAPTPDQLKLPSAPGLSIAGSSTRRAGGAPPTGPSASSNLFTRALSSSAQHPLPTNPRGSLGRKREAGDDDGSSRDAKRRVSGLEGAPRGPRSNGEQQFSPAGGASLLSRLAPGAAPGGGGKDADEFQRKIDALTASQGGDLLSTTTAPTAGGGGLPRRPNQPQQQQRAFNPHQQQQQQQGGWNPGMMEMMGMGGMMMGGSGGMGLQEMMMAQMQQMAQMQAQMAAMAAQQNAPPPPHSSAARPPLSAAPYGKRHNADPLNRPSNPAFAPTPPTVPLPAKPTSSDLCKFSIGCTHPTCPYSHPSPSATSDLALVLSTEPCKEMLSCANPDCTLSHVSPSQKPGGGGGKGKVECKFQECKLRKEGKCEYAHRNAAGELEEGTGKGLGEGLGLKDRVLGAGVGRGEQGGTTTGKACKFGAKCTRADCKFSHPPNRQNPSSRSNTSSFAPYARPPVSTKFAASPVRQAGNKSMTFNVDAKPFVPKSAPPAVHMSTRFAPLAAAEGGEKIIPSSSSSTTTDAVAKE